MKAKRTKDNYISGDVVLFKGSNRIVLNRVEIPDQVVMYHIFHPDKGIYTAIDDELQYVGHLDEMDKMIKKLNEVGLKETA